MITLLVIAASSLWGMYLAYKLGRWHGEQATVALLRKDIKWRKS
jgi:membrane protein DedA with SNARE-associated domain